MKEDDLDRHARAAETKKRRTRQRITEAVLSLFDEEDQKGPPTLEQIAEEAGVGVATLYSHFNTKFELYQEVLEQLFDPLERPIKTAIEAGAYEPVDFRAEIVSYIARSASLLFAHRQLLGVYLQAYFETRQHELPTVLASFMSEGLLLIMKAANKGPSVRFEWGSADYHANAFLLKICERYAGWGPETTARSAASEILRHMLSVVDRVNGLGDFEAVKSQLDVIMPKESES